MTPSKKLFEIITFPGIIVHFLCVKRNNRPLLLIVLGNKGFEISARPKLVSVPFSSQYFLIGRLEKSFPESK